MGKVIVNIVNDMSDVLDAAQLRRLQDVLLWRLEESEKRKYDYTNEEYLNMFLTAKKLEGCSARTTGYYEYSIRRMLRTIDRPVVKISTGDIREYLVAMQESTNTSKAYVDVVRRQFSSFFAWLEDEEYIIASPVKRIHKIRTSKKVKDTISDENVEKLRDGCKNNRDLAMVDFLLSTGVRVGELVTLDISDIDLDNRECVVHGKGDKERRVYFDMRTRIHIIKYLDDRKDDNPALFVSMKWPYERLSIHGVEARMRALSERNKVDDLHPHKFRRTMATKAIDKGMPIEQVQKLLGHQQIDTTLQYAMVNQENVKMAHRKILG